MMRLLLVGHGEHGKDSAGEYLSQITTLRYAGSTSNFLAKYVAAETGQTVERAFATRREHRQQWYDIGRRLRESDPGILIRESLAVADIAAGCRDLEEIIACREQRMVDLIVWIANRNKPDDPTVKFGSEVADIVVENHWGLSEFQGRLRRLAKSLGILRRE